MFYIFLTYGFGYGLWPKFFGAERSATAEGENHAYGPTLGQKQDCRRTNFMAENTSKIQKLSFSL